MSVLTINPEIKNFNSGHTDLVSFDCQTFGFSTSGEHFRIGLFCFFSGRERDELVLCRKECLS